MEVPGAIKNSDDVRDSDAKKRQKPKSKTRRTGVLKAKIVDPASKSSNPKTKVLKAKLIDNEDITNQKVAEKKTTQSSNVKRQKTTKRKSLSGKDKATEAKGADAQVDHDTKRKKRKDKKTVKRPEKQKAIPRNATKDKATIDGVETVDNSNSKATQETEVNTRQKTGEKEDARRVKRRETVEVAKKQVKSAESEQNKNRRRRKTVRKTVSKAPKNEQLADDVTDEVDKDSGLSKKTKKTRRKSAKTAANQELKNAESKEAENDRSLTTNLAAEVPVDSSDNKAGSSVDEHNNTGPSGTEARKAKTESKSETKSKAKVRKSKTTTVKKQNSKTEIDEPENDQDLSSEEIPSAKTKKAKSNSKATEEVQSPVEEDKSKLRLKSKTKRRRSLTKKEKTQQDANELDAENDQSESAATGSKKPLLAIGGVLAVLLVVVVGVSQLPSQNKRTQKKTARTHNSGSDQQSNNSKDTNSRSGNSENKSNSENSAGKSEADSVAKDKSSPKSDTDKQKPEVALKKVVSPFPNGAPRNLPADPGEALQLIDRYREHKPDDYFHLARLYKQLRGKLRPGSRAARSVDQMLDYIEQQKSLAAAKQYEKAEKEAQAAIANNDYKLALEIWQKAYKLQTDVDVAESIREDIDFLKTAIAQVAKMTKLYDEVKDKSSNDTQMKKIGALLNECRKIKSSKAYKNLYSYALTIRKQTRELYRSQANERLQKIRDSIKKQKTELEDNYKRREQLAIKNSKKKPVSFKARPAVVTQLDETSFTLKTLDGSLEKKLRYEQEPLLAAKVLTLSCRKDNLEDHFKLYEYCILQEQFLQASRAYKAILKIDRRFALSLPDPTSVKNQKRSFAGSKLPKTDKWPGAVYDFAKAKKSYLDEFINVDKRNKVKLSGSSLIVNGPNPMVYFKEIGFDFFIFVRFKFGYGVSCDPMMNFIVTDKQQRSHRYVVYVKPSQNAYKVMYSNDGSPLKDLGDWVRNSYGLIEMQLSGNKFFVNSESNKDSFPAVEFQSVRVAVTSATDRNTSNASVNLDKFIIGGSIRQKWLRKNHAENKTKLFKKLFDAKSQLLKVERVKFDVERSTLPSADDAFSQAGVSQEQLQAYTKSWEEIHQRKFSKPGRKAVEDVIQAQGNLPGAYLARSYYLFNDGFYEESLNNIDQALELDPEFAEARLRRGRIWLLLGDVKKGQTDIEAAAKFLPDLAETRKMLADIALRAEDMAKAQDELALVTGLDPSDKTAQRLYQGVTKVIAGPAWETIHEAKTNHFIVRTDISLSRARAVGKLLESARSVYQKNLNGLKSKQNDKKAVCLVFNTEIGFQNYSALMSSTAHGSRVLGLYSGLFKQLLFFEDKSDADGSSFKETLYHEGFHRYVDESVPGLPIWLNEGMAEYCAGVLSQYPNAVIRGRLNDVVSFLRPPPARSGGGFQLSLPKFNPFPLRRARRAPTMTKLESLLLMNQQQFYQLDGPVNYARAWAFCHFLRSGSASAALEKGFVKYLELLAKNIPYERAHRIAFEKVNWTQTERDWKQYVLSLGQ